ncbi:MAG TPA: AfsR/SARP family transcriptional regulator [Streptosporangiaceae bacterium]|nr:AfsR/SARP family transcriptional regulator [Streptosporangiaceae bacterium]
MIHADVTELDALKFYREVQMSQKLWHGQDAATVASDLAGALDLWRGPALAGMRDVPLIGAASQRLDRQYLAVAEDWAEAELAAGGAIGAVDRIIDLAVQYPFRERLRLLQMTALAQAGRRSEALAVYDELRQLLARELGLTPGEPVVRLYQSLLRDEEAASLRPLPCPAVRCTLPWDLPAFVGRVECVRHLKSALNGDISSLAVITGPVGAGKTALAVHTAHAVGDDFPDGRYFVRLRGSDGAPRRTDEVLAELIGAVDRSRCHAPGTYASQFWQHWLTTHRALVVLDDARSEAELQPLIPGAGRSAVIITARRSIGGLLPAIRVRVACLSMAEALDLLRRLIGARRVALDYQAARRLVSATGLLPLGVRLVAERLTQLRHVPLREYAARIDDESGLLEELTAADSSIRIRLAEAIGDLPEAARRALPRLSRLPERWFTLAEAAAALEADDRATVRILEALLEANVVSTPDLEAAAGAVMYEMEILSRAFAREVESPA